MAQHTTSDDAMAREELASYLADLATEFQDGGDGIAVGVGNKTVTLDPPESVDVSISVLERSPVLRGQHETIDLEISWKPDQPE